MANRKAGLLFEIAKATNVVFMRPEDKYKASVQDNAAIKTVENLLNNRGTAPRTYRNMLAFIAPDQDLMAALKLAARRYLEWKSIKEDSEYLNLDAAQNRETENNLIRNNSTVD